RVVGFVRVVGCSPAPAADSADATSGGDSIDPSAGSGTTTSGADEGVMTTPAHDSSGAATTGADTTAGPKFDVGGNDTDGTGTGGVVDVCHVHDDMDAIGECEITAPPDS